MQLSVENTKITSISDEKNRGVYSIEPLPAGFGSTLGNSLRRVLLTSIKGSAITQVKIAGVTHQFTTVPGIKEDVVELTLNFKKVRARIHTDSPVIATIKKKGPGVVTAKDIETSSDVEILNKEMHIATLANNKTELNVELVFEPGVGYSPVEERPTNKIGVIVLDALFSPILNTTYQIVPTRFGQRADLDRLIITVETDGSISPKDALKQSCDILRDYYAQLMTEETAEPEGNDKSDNEKRAKSTETVAVEELPLQTRTINALKKHGIETLQQLGKLNDEQIADIKNLGEKSMTEIKKLLEKEGFR